MDVKGIKERIEAKKKETKEQVMSKRIEINMLRAHVNEKGEILRERIELRKLKIKSKKFRIKLNKPELDAEVIAIPTHILRLAEVIAESAYDYEVSYVFILNSKNVVEDVIPLTHPNVLKQRDQEHVELDLHDFKNERFILCHTHPNGFVELSEDECELKNYVNLAVHVIYPLQEYNPAKRNYQYIGKTTITWCSQYFKHILKIHSEKIKQINCY